MPCVYVYYYTQCFVCGCGVSCWGLRESRVLLEMIVRMSVMVFVLWCWMVWFGLVWWGRGKDLSLMSWHQQDDSRERERKRENWLGLEICIVSYMYMYQHMFSSFEGYVVKLVAFYANFVTHYVLILLWFLVYRFCKNIHGSRDGWNAMLLLDCRI